MLMCLLQRLSLKRITVTPEQVESWVGHDQRDNIMREAASLAKSQADNTECGVMYDYVRELEALKQKVEVLEARDNAVVLCSLCATPVKRRRAVYHSWL